MVWGDTGGSLFAITTTDAHLDGVAESVTTLIARNDAPDASLDDDITGTRSGKHCIGYCFLKRACGCIDERLCATFESICG